MPVVGAMVAAEDDDRVFIQTALFEKTKQQAEDMVDLADAGQRAPPGSAEEILEALAGFAKLRFHVPGTGLHILKVRWTLTGIRIPMRRQGQILRVEIPETLVGEERMVRLLESDLHAERALIGLTHESHGLLGAPHFQRLLKRQRRGPGVHRDGVGTVESGGVVPAVLLLAKTLGIEPA